MNGRRCRAIRREALALDPGKARLYVLERKRLVDRMGKFVGLNATRITTGPRRLARMMRRTGLRGAEALSLYRKRTAFLAKCRVVA